MAGHRMLSAGILSLVLPFKGSEPLRRKLASALALLAATTGPLSFAAEAAPALVIDASSGDVLYQEDATEPWFPASLTKLMTVYVALQAVRDHKIALDTPLVVSRRAATMPPSKMGFAPGTEVTLDNALRMLLVRSANDLAITIAEGVSGSVEAFADDMNATAARIGLHESHFVNPNGLPDPRHVSSARDMATIARALLITFPEHADLYNIGTLALDSQIIPNHNNLLGRYPGADGMKTGFTCPAGFNIVASAERGGRRVIAVVLGAPNVSLRTSKVALLFDRAFTGIDRPKMSLAALGPTQGGAAPDMRDQICKARGKAKIQFSAEVEALAAPFTAETGSVSAPVSPSSPLFSTATLFRNAPPVMTRLDLVPTPIFTPVPVFIGRTPGYIGPVAQARPGHSPVGTEAPPETASAYASDPAGLDNNPLKPDPTALPIRGRKPVKLAAPKHKAEPAVASEEADEKPVAKTGKAKHTGKAKVAAKPQAAKTQKTAKVEKPAPLHNESANGKAAPKKLHVASPNKPKPAADSSKN